MELSEYYGWPSMVKFPEIRHFFASEQERGAILGFLKPKSGEGRRLVDIQDRDIWREPPYFHEWLAVALWVKAAELQEQMGEEMVKIAGLMVEKLSSMSQECLEPGITGIRKIRPPLLELPDVYMASLQVLVGDDGMKKKEWRTNLLNGLGSMVGHLARASVIDSRVDSQRSRLVQVLHQKAQTRRNER